MTIDELLEILDGDLNALIKPLADEIRKELQRDKPRISQLGRTIGASVSDLFGDTDQAAGRSAIGVYTRGVLIAARSTSLGLTVPVSLEQDIFGKSSNERLVIIGQHLKSMLLANLRFFVTGKSKVSKDQVRGWFDEFLTVTGSEVALGQSGAKGLHEVRRLLRTEAVREYGVGLIQNAILNGGNIRWRLAHRHSHQDECDLNAARDNYGLGPGIYPPNAVPRFPNHPYDECRLELVSG